MSPEKIIEILEQLKWKSHKDEQEALNYAIMRIKNTPNEFEVEAFIERYRVIGFSAKHLLSFFLFGKGKEYFGEK